MVSPYRPRLFVFGLGYAAARIAQAWRARGGEVVSTGRDGDLAFDDAGTVRMALADASHVLSSVPPAGDGSDPVLEAYGDALGGRWLGYLSSTGVYGDTQGAWVDESAPIGQGRRSARAEADAAWAARGAHVFRLPGIYGPGRSAFERLAAGRAHRVDLPGQVFSRIHVDDIASGVMAAIAAGTRVSPGPWNLADDHPAPQNAVIETACALSGLPLPPLTTLEDADLGPMARAFYAENRRVANGRARRLLGWQPRYPDWRAGLLAIWREGRKA